MTPFIKLATKSGTPNILSVIQKSYAPFYDLIPENCGFDISLDELNNIIEDKRAMSWIAVYNNDVIGIATGITFAPKAYHLKLLFISNRFQRQGIAAKLLVTFEQFGKVKGFNLFTTNYQKWATWSRDFYIKHGYKEYSIVDEYGFSELRQTVSYYREIGRLNNDHKCLIWKTV